MADTVRIIDTGFVELDRKLDQLSKKVQTSVIRKTMRRVGKVLLADVKALAPRGDGNTSKRGRKGSLVSRIKLRSVKSRRHRTGPRVVGVQIESQAFYGTFLELGTVERTREKRSLRSSASSYSTGKIERGKFTFIRRAAKRNKKKLVREFGKQLRIQIKEIAAK